MTLLPLASRNWAVPILQLKNYFLLLSQVSLKNHKTPLAVSEVFIYLFKTVQFNFCKELNCGAPLYTLYHIFLFTILKMWVILNLLWMLLKMDLQMSTSTTISLAVETAWGSDTNTYLPEANVLIIPLTITSGRGTTKCTSDKTISKSNDLLPIIWNSFTFKKIVQFKVLMRL